MHLQMPNYYHIVNKEEEEEDREKDIYTQAKRGRHKNTLKHTQTHRQKERKKRNDGISEGEYSK